VPKEIDIPFFVTAIKFYVKRRFQRVNDEVRYRISNRIPNIRPDRDIHMSDDFNAVNRNRAKSGVAEK